MDELEGDDREEEVMGDTDGGMRIERVSIDALRPNPWNPNEMDDETFNRLAEELDEETGVGYIDPIQAVPMDDGTFQIIGGEHRWRAMRANGHESIEIVVLGDEKWRDEDLRKFVTTRLNALHGKINPQKFMDLYMDLAKRHDEEALQALMGFTDRDAWGALVKDTRKGLADAGVPKEKLKEFDAAVKEMKTVDDLSLILNKIFTEHGDTLSSNFMVFTFGGKEHLMVQLPKKSFTLAKAAFGAAYQEGKDVGELMAKLLERWEDVVAG